MRSFLKTLFSVPNIVALAFFLIGVGTWWEDQKLFRAQMEERVKHIEIRLDTIEAAAAITYVRRDVMAEQLAGIQRDVTALRDQVQGVKNDVRKIR